MLLLRKNLFSSLMVPTGADPGTLGKAEHWHRPFVLWADAFGSPDPNQHHGQSDRRAPQQFTVYLQ